VLGIRENSAEPISDSGDLARREMPSNPRDQVGSGTFQTMEDRIRGEMTAERVNGKLSGCRVGRELSSRMSERTKNRRFSSV
jgi:hypothetical protein